MFNCCMCWYVKKKLYIEFHVYVSKFILNKSYIMDFVPISAKVVSQNMLVGTSMNQIKNNLKVTSYEPH